MIFDHSSKNKKVLLFITLIVLIVGVFLFLYSPIIFQEGNPYPQIKGIIQLTFGKSDMVKLFGSDNKYITKNKNNQEIIRDFMKEKGYEFIEQLGAGYLFKSDIGVRAIAVHKYYSRYYSLWNIIEDLDIIEANNNSWERAILAVNNCEVVKVFQTHSKIVTLTLKNGSKLTAEEPQIDDIIFIVNAAETKCGKIPIGTE